MYAPRDRVIAVNKAMTFGCLLFSPAVIGGPSLAFMQYQGQWLTATNWIDDTECLINMSLSLQDVTYRASKELPSLVPMARGLTATEGWYGYSAAGQELKFRITPFRAAEDNEIIWACYYTGFEFRRGILLSASQLIQFARQQIGFCCSFSQHNRLCALMIESMSDEQNHEFPLIYPKDVKSYYSTIQSLC